MELRVRTRTLLVVMAWSTLLVVVGTMGLSQAEAAKDPVWSKVLDPTGNSSVQVDISANGLKIAAGTNGPTPKLWIYNFSAEPFMVEESWNTKALNSSVVDLALSAQGEALVVGLNVSQFDDVNYYLTESSTPVWTASSGGLIEDVAISADGLIIAVGGANGLSVYNVDSAIPRWQNDTVGKCLSVALSQDGKYLAAGMEDGTIAFYRTTDKDAVMSFKAGNMVSQVDLSANGMYLAAVSTDGLLYYFDTGTEKPSWTWVVGNVAFAVSMSDNGESILAGDEQLLLFDREARSPIGQYQFGGSSPTLQSIALSASGEYSTAAVRHSPGFGTARERPHWFEHDPYQAGGNNMSMEVTDIAITGEGLYSVTGSADGQLLLFYANSAPEIELLTPEDGVQSSETTLIWQGTDVDGDDLTYTLYFEKNNTKPGRLISGLTEPFFIPTAQLQNGENFYWKVVASDGVHETESATWNFTFEDIGPELTILGAALKGGALVLEGTASDEVRVVHIEVRMDDGDWQLIPGQEEWTYPWRVAEMDFGGSDTSDHTLYARSFDGKSYSDEDELAVTLTRPTLTLEAHGFDPDDRSIYLLEGSATGMNGVAKVEVKADNGDWVMAQGQEDWEFIWPTYTVGPGAHTLSIRAYDGVWFTDTQTISVTTEGPGATPGKVPKKLKGNVTFTMNVANPTPESRAQVRVSNDTWTTGWIPLEGNGSIRSHTWDSNGVSDGAYKVEFRYFEGYRESHLGTFNSKVANDEPESSTLDGICLILITPFLLLLLLALWLLYGKQLGAREESEDNECVYCGFEGSDDQPLHRAHLVAPSKGGQKPVTACQTCNLSKGDKALMEWLRWTKQERPHRWELIVEWNEEPKEGEVPEKVRKIHDEGPGPDPDDDEAFKAIAAAEDRERDEESSDCIYCGETENLHRTHRVLEDEPPQAACASCDVSRGQSERDLEGWLGYIKEERPDKWEQIVEHNKGKRGDVPEHVRALRDERPDTCIYCGSHDDIQETSLVAASKGGAKKVAACAGCNRSKGTKALMDWLRWTREERPERWEDILEFNHGKRGEVPSKVHKVRDEPGPASKKQKKDDDEEAFKAIATAAREEEEPEKKQGFFARRKAKKEAERARREAEEDEEDFDEELEEEDEAPDKEFKAPPKPKQKAPAEKKEEASPAPRKKADKEPPKEEPSQEPSKPKAAAKPKAETKPKAKAKAEEKEPCIYCGATKNLHSGHVVRGGQEPVTACASCNMSRRTDKNLEEWLAWTKERKAKKWDKIVAYNMGKKGEVAEIVREMRD